MSKILQSGDHICLFCGEAIAQHYDEYTPYYECNCKDAVRDRQIDEEIRKLNQMRPKPQFEIIQKNVLYKTRKDDV